MAKKLGRNFIGIEQDKNYIKEAKEKELKNVSLLGKKGTRGNRVKRENQIRIPFGNLDPKTE